MAFFMEECPKTIAGVQELYQQLLPTKVYYNRKTKSQVSEEKCRLCGDSLENVQHILSGCSALNLVPRGPFCHALELSIPSLTKRIAASGNEIVVH